MTETLVIGWGNDLLGDDAVGVRAADAVASWGMAAVLAIPCPQLLPEMAAAVADARRVIFIDAAVDCRHVRTTRIGPQRADLTAPHDLDPPGLLALAHVVFGQAPEAWMVAIPAASFEPLAALSPRARSALDQALRVIGLLVGRGTQV